VYFNSIAFLAFPTGENFHKSTFVFLYAFKGHRQADIELHSFLTLFYHCNASATLTSGKNLLHPLNRTQAVLNIFGKEKISFAYWDLKLETSGA
jgi:hypothetical protein